MDITVRSALTSYQYSIEKWAQKPEQFPQEAENISKINASREDTFTLDGGCMGQMQENDYIEVQGKKYMSSEPMDKVSERINQIVATRNNMAQIVESSKAQIDQAKEHTKDIMKELKDKRIALEIYRRIKKGGKVPLKDEKWLADYSLELYMQAKMAAMLERAKEQKKYDSVLENEENEETQTTGEGSVSEITATGSEIAPVDAEPAVMEA